MAFRLLARPDLVPDEAEAVSNNHFDQDGPVSLYALVDPDEAVRRRRFLEDVACADFGLRRDRDAARLSMLLSALAGGDDLPADYPERTGVLLYEDVLGRLLELAPPASTATSGVTRTPRSPPATLRSRTAGPIEERPDVDLAVVRVAEDTPDAGGHRFGGA